jgi:hypothetical protein
MNEALRLAIDQAKGFAAQHFSLDMLTQISCKAVVPHLGNPIMAKSNKS